MGFFRPQDVCTALRALTLGARAVPGTAQGCIVARSVSNFSHCVVGAEHLNRDLARRQHDSAEDPVPSEVDSVDLRRTASRGIRQGLRKGTMRRGFCCERDRSGCSGTAMGRQSAALFFDKVRGK